jgi:hypothetical protein
MGNLKKGALTVEELVRSERHWISVSQEDSFTTQISTLKKKQALPRKDHLLALNPFIDSHGILRVGGRGSHSEMSYNSRHPVILPGKHPITKLIVRTKHLRLLHAGTTLIAESSLSHLGIKESCQRCSASLCYVSSSSCKTPASVPWSTPQRTTLTRIGIRAHGGGLHWTCVGEMRK